MEINNPDYVEVIFEKNNKEYGAYQIRTNYNKNILIALLASAIVFTLSLIVPGVIASISNDGIALEDPNNVQVELLEIRSIDEKKEELPPPPPPEMEPPKVDMERFLEPEIKKDELVDPEKKPVDVDSLKKSNSGDKKQEGNDFHKDNIDDGDGDDVGKVVDDEPLLFVAEQAEFPGGNDAMQKFIIQNTVYPNMARKMGIEGKVFVSFVIEKDGSISNVNVVRGVDKSLDGEAVRVVSMMPKWKPGKNNGYAVRLKKTIPINFTLN